MKKINLHIISLLIVTLFCFAQCKKHPVAKTELEKLPAATQTGAHTFGCLLNGVAYIPGGGGVSSVLSVVYDPTFQGGSLSIRAKKILNSNQSVRITLNGDTINEAGNYPLFLHSKFNVIYSYQLNCNFHTYYDNPISGLLNISKFDNAARIISGTFSFKVSTISCGTIEATDGRFDVKY